MSLENILVQNGARENAPRSDISVNKLYYNEIIDPLLLGLIPNSTAPADMTTNVEIIQAALDVGGVINFPSGTYYVNVGLIVDTNDTQFIGAGIDVSVIKASSTFVGSLLSIVATSSGVAVSGVKLSGITLDGNAANAGGSATCCLALVNAQNCIISEVKCYCATTEGLLITTNGSTSYGNIISDCLIQYSVLDGISFTGVTVTGTSSDVYNNIVNGCNISFSGDAGLVFVNTSECLVTNTNIYRSNSDGFYCQGSYSCNVSNCSIDRSANYGIETKTTAGSIFVGNIVQYSNQGNTGKYSIAVGGLTTGSQFTNNTLTEDATSISDSQVGPNGVTYPGKTIANVNGITIVNNTATNNNIAWNTMTSTITNRINGLSTYTNQVLDSKSASCVIYTTLSTLTDNVSLKATSGFAINTNTVTSGIGFATAADGFIGVNFAGAVIVNLPAVIDVHSGGWVVIVKDVSGAAGVNNITVAATDLIDGAATKVISSNYGVLRIICDGTTYWTF